MSLQNLNTVFEQTQKACLGVSLTSIPNLPQKFKDDYAKLIVEDTFFSRNDRIFWGRDGAAELWSRGKRTRIYVPSVGFFIAWHLVPLYRELISYRTMLSAILEAHGKTLNDIEEPDCVPYIEAATSLSQAEKEYLKKFVTDGSWWGKGRQISRAQDFFESPLMQCARLTQETQSEIARITKQLSENPTLFDSLNVAAKENFSTSSKRPRQLIIYGAPGTGKSWWIKGHTAGCDVIRTTFHPDSDYSTFVGAYKPSMEDDGFKTVVTTGEVSPSGSIAKNDGLVTQKRIVYKFVAQAFLKAYVEAWKKMVMGGTLAENAENAEGCPASENSARGSADATERVPPVYLVIEEINRGNCAQIFGDLFQLLDRNDEGFSEYEIAADDDLRRYLVEAFRGVRGAEKMERVFRGEILLLPPNLCIWATMNTSDQSLFPIDSAFKRRWEWKYMPIHDAQKGYRIAVGADAYDWWDFLDKANAFVEGCTDSEDKKLGYFFCKANPDGTIPLERFVGKVVFYLWNDVFRDVGFDHEVFADGNGGRLLFKDFFNPDGSPRAEAVRQFLENLGVARVVSDGNIAGDASSASEAVAEGVSA